MSRPVTKESGPPSAFQAVGSPVTPSFNTLTARRPEGRAPTRQSEPIGELTERPHQNIWYRHNKPCRFKSQPTAKGSNNITQLVRLIFHEIANGAGQQLATDSHQYGLPDIIDAHRPASMHRGTRAVERRGMRPASASTPFRRKPLMPARHRARRIQNSQPDSRTAVSPAALVRMKAVVASGLTPTAEIWTTPIPRAAQAHANALIAWKWNDVKVIAPTPAAVSQHSSPRYRHHEERRPTPRASHNSRRSRIIHAISGTTVRRSRGTAAKAGDFPSLRPEPTCNRRADQPISAKDEDASDVGMCVVVSHAAPSRSLRAAPDARRTPDQRSVFHRSHHAHVKLG